MKTKETKYPVALPEKNIYETDCPILYALNLVGQKWKLPIMWHLAQHKVVRYNEMKRCVKGITNMMLTKSLQELEACGLVTRCQHPVIPPRVEYSLTEHGEKLLPTLNELYLWGEQMQSSKHLDDNGREKKL